MSQRSARQPGGSSPRRAPRALVRRTARGVPLAERTLPHHTHGVVKLLIGILKGAVIGGALGYGAYALGDVPVLTNPWVLYGLIGALVGLVVGRPIWSLIRDKNATSVIAILKAAFGFGIGCGLYALVAKAINP